MKELTIEQKAKAYDEAKLRMSTAYNSNRCTIGFMNEIFPELKESEDERIRKTLILFFTERTKYTEDSTFCGLPSKKIVAWLEKQGENNMGISEATKQELEDNLNKALEKETPESWNKFLDEQGEQKPINKIDSFKIKKDPNPYWTLAPEYQLANKQKLADKVEPKFKLGDIITNGELIGKVDENENNKYHGWFGYNKDFSVHYSDIPDIENWHKWTIQDAKDGDVLVNWNNTIYLFKGIEEEVVKFYCYYNTNCEEFKTPLDNNSHLGLTEPQFEHHPATKEQCKLLFQKMKEADYVWDSEKKELKKIEQKSDNWEPQTGDTFRKKGTTSPTYHLCDKQEDGITFGFVENREVGISGGEITIFALRQDYELVERPKSVEDIVEEELNRVSQTKVEQKPTWSKEDELHIRELESLVKQVWATAERENDKETIHKMSDLSFFLKTLKPQLKQEWSEEDEEMHRKCICAMRASACGFPEEEKFVEQVDNWLKFLKDRVQPQLKQEWSEEDKKMLQSILDEYKSMSIEKRNWLKHLRPQNSIVTDEELAQAKNNAYNDALDKIEYHSGEPTFDDGWSAAIWYMKKRNAQPQNRWKPSDEQMDALWDSIKHNLHLHPVLNSLYSDLKKLRKK